MAKFTECDRCRKRLKEDEYEFVVFGEQGADGEKQYELCNRCWRAALEFVTSPPPNFREDR